MFGKRHRSKQSNHHRQHSNYRPPHDNYFKCINKNRFTYGSQFNLNQNYPPNKNSCFFKYFPEKYKLKREMSLSCINTDHQSIENPNDEYIDDNFKTDPDQYQLRSEYDCFYGLSNKIDYHDDDAKVRNSNWKDRQLKSWLSIPTHIDHINCDLGQIRFNQDDEEEEKEKRSNDEIKADDDPTGLNENSDLQNESIENQTLVNIDAGK